MRINKFWLSRLFLYIHIYLILLCRDILFSIYIYFKKNIFYWDNVAFKEAFVASLIFFIPILSIQFLFYKYGKGSKYDKEKRLKEKLTYKIINERYREKKREKD